MFPSKTTDFEDMIECLPFSLQSLVPKRIRKQPDTKLHSVNLETL